MGIAGHCLGGYCMDIHHYDVIGASMTKSAVMLDPYTRKATIHSAGKIRTCSYAEAIGTPKNAEDLPKEAITTICKALKRPS